MEKNIEDNMDERISNVLDDLAKKQKFEYENCDKVDHSERMLAITPDIGLFYNGILKSIDASRILEIGTSVGYSTIWFAEAIMKNDDAHIITIDNDKQKIERACKNYENAGVEKIIENQYGDALDILKKISNDITNGNLGKFDFAFIDADKERYIDYFDMVLPMIRKGGYIGADNILKPEIYNEYTMKYVKHVQNNPAVQSLTIPIDYGEELSLVIK